MMDKVRQCGVGEGTKGLVGGPTLAKQDILVKQLLHFWNELDSQVCLQNVSRGNQQLLAHMRNLVRADGEEREHSLDHQVRVLGDLILVDPK